MWHPATLLIGWAGFAFLLQWLSLVWLLTLTIATCFLGNRYAPERSWRMVRKSRWLLLSLAILFIFFTPGEYAPGIAGSFGITYDGLMQAAEQLGLIMAMLISLALLHEYLGTQGLLAGLYWLLSYQRGRNQSIIRLMLVLDFVENRQSVGWREWLMSAGETPQAHEVISFQFPEAAWRDKSVMALIVAMMIVWVVVL